MGAWLAIVLAGVVAVILVIAMFTSMMSGEVAGFTKNSALQITLEGSLEERANSVELGLSDLLRGNGEKVQTVEDLVAAIGEAKTNEKVKCIYLDCRGIAGAPASLHAVREALVDFKTSKKKIFAYADSYTGSDYFLASVADEIVLNPAGEIQLHGIGGVNLFLKDFFDKVGVEFQAVRVGKGKAAVEPYTCSEMSDVARQQSMALYDTLWLGMRQEMSSKERGITPALIDTLINRDILSCRPASFILDKKLVTSLQYRHQFEDKVAEYCGQKDGLEHVVTPSQLLAVTDSPMNSYTADNQVAVLYACGGIDTGGMGGGGINSPDLVDEILSLADNDKVKALVLRVNSPGGSAYGSEQIWEALEVFKKTGKPFVVSMGDYAASGGYYISAGAQRIFADQFTITGSIGIYGLIPNISGLLGKLGINPQMVATNPDALFPTLMYPLSDKQYAAMQSMVENGYSLFVKRCAEGRHMTVAKIEEIADGRPLAATVAKSYGLVDEIGSLQKAIDYAASTAKLKKWKAVSYPNAAGAFAEMLKQFNQESAALELLTGTNPQRMMESAREIVQSFSGRHSLHAAMPTIIFSY